MRSAAESSETDLGPPDDDTKNSWGFLAGAVEDERQKEWDATNSNNERKENAYKIGKQMSLSR